MQTHISTITVTTSATVVGNVILLRSVVPFWFHPSTWVCVGGVTTTARPARSLMAVRVWGRGTSCSTSPPFRPIESAAPQVSQILIISTKRVPLFISQISCSLLPAKLMCPSSLYIVHAIIFSHTIADTCVIFAIGGVLVDSAHCLQESLYDRPTAAYLNFCPRALSTDPTHFDAQLYLVLKELIHSLVWPRCLNIDSPMAKVWPELFHFRHFQRSCILSTTMRRVIPVRPGTRTMEHRSFTMMGKSPSCFC